MGFFKNLLQRVVELDPELLLTLPSGIVSTEGNALMRQNEIYLAEQLDKKVRFAEHIGQKELEQMMYRSLEDLRIDDFIFLYDKMRDPDKDVAVDRIRVQGAYNALARKGNVNDLENLVKKTRVPVKLSQSSVDQGYDSLAAQGRLEAMDYLRQLSQIPVHFSHDAVQAGYASLLIAGKYATMARMKDACAIKPKIPRKRLNDALAKECQNLDFKAVFLLSHMMDAGFKVSKRDFSRYSSRIVSEQKYSQLPYLIQIAPERSAESLNPELLDDAFRNADSVGLELLYSQKGLSSHKRAHSDHAYKVAVSSMDVSLLMKVAKARGRHPDARDLRSLLENSMLSDNIDEINFLSDEADGTVSISPEIVQSFFYSLMLKDRRDLISHYGRKLSITFDQLNAGFYNAVRTGDIGGIVSYYDSNPSIQENIPWAKQVYDSLKDGIKNEK